MTLSLKCDRQQAEDCHVKAQLCDCRMAEQLSEPAQVQHRSNGKDDGERHHRVADERRDQDAANDQLGKCVHHDTDSLGGAAGCSAASMTSAATTRSLLMCSARSFCTSAVFLRFEATSRRRSVSCAARAVSASAT